MNTLATDDVVRPEAGGCYAEPLRIVYQDDVMVAIDKPSGLLVHRSPIDRHESHFAVQKLRDQLGQRVYPVHRLDKPTSGLLLFALDSMSAKHLAQQFERGTCDKRYFAVVRGHAASELVIDHPLRDEVDAQGRRITGGESREASTTWRTLRTYTVPEPVDRYPEGRYSLVELTPHTGRFRQLRRHAKHVSHPIIGDTRYGKGSHNRFFRQRFGCHRLMLAAVEMRVEHPLSGAPVALLCPPAEDFVRVLDALSAGS